MIAQPFVESSELVGSSILTAVPVPASAASSAVKASPSNISKGFGEDLSVAAILKKSQEDSSNPSSSSSSHIVSGHDVISFADLIKCELNDKQKVIEKLLDELQDKNNGIALCGKDIRELREQKILYESRINELNKSLRQSQCEQNELISAIQCVPRAEKKYVSNQDHQFIMESLFTNFKTLKDQTVDLQKQVQKRDTELEEFSTLKSRHAELEKTQQQTVDFLKTMKSEIAKLESYRLAIHTQEKVIAKLQSVIESKFKSKFSFMKEISASITEASNRDLVTNSTVASITTPLQNPDQLQILRDENEKLLEKVEQLQQELQSSALKSSNNASRPSTQHSQFSSETDDNGNLMEGQSPANFQHVKKANLKIDQLVAENISKQFRIDALEKQLELAARESGREIARLRTKLFEMEMLLSMTNTISNDENNVPEEEEEEEEEEETLSPELSVSVEDLKPDILGNISPRNRKTTIFLQPEEPPSIIPKPIESPSKQEVKAPSVIPEQPVVADGGNRTRADSGFDIDRIPTPEEVKQKPSPSKKSTREMPKEGNVERSFPLFDESSQEPTIMGEATIVFQYQHDKPKKQHQFTMTRVKVENYPMEDGKTKFDLFTVVSVVDDKAKLIWKIETPPVRDPGSMVQWDHDASQAVDGKLFSIGESDFLKFVNSDDHGGLTVKCVLKKKSKGHIGAGSVALLY